MAAANDDGTNDADESAAALLSVENEPGGESLPPKGAGTKEPEPPARPLNRAERRRLAALARKARRAAA